MKRNRKEIEGPRDCVRASRTMLLKNMRIENVKEEMNKLNDFIVFERERIKEA